MTRPVPMTDREEAVFKSLRGAPLTPQDHAALGSEPYLRARPRNVWPGWDSPVALEDGRALPEFPVGAMPPWLADFVMATAEATQTPTDLPGMMALGALATAAGGRAIVQPRVGWREPLNLFLVTAMGPGNRKSAVVESVIRPLRAAEREAVVDAASRVSEATTARTIAISKAKKLAQRAADAAASGSDDSDALARDATIAAEVAQGIEVPVLPRFLADDCTPEALASLMAEQRGRLAVISAEGGIFDIIAGKYSKVPSFDVFLKGHAGDEIRVDRVGRKPEHIAKPALTLALAVQPAVLRTIADREGFRGRGLLARFMFVIPASFVGSRLIGAPAVPDNVSDQYEGNMRALVHSLSAQGEPSLIRLSADAEDRLLQYEAEIEPTLANSGELAHLADWGSKLVGATVRVAGLLHLATRLKTGYEEPVASYTIDAAAQFGDYFKRHAIAAHTFMGTDDAISDARVVLKWLTGRRSFSKRDLHRALASRFPKSEDLSEPLAILEDRGWIKRQADPKIGPDGGRPRSPVYDVHPAHASESA